MTARLFGILALAASFAAAPALAVEWRSTADRALDLLDSGKDARTICMLKKAKEDGTDDRYVADYYNIQQAAGGLPENVSFEQFLNGVSYKLREQLGKDSYDGLSDDELTEAVRTYDGVIFRIFRFLNSNVHQAAAGEVHKALYNYILDNTKNSSTLYSCYKETFVDER